jgi:hypothetical protein
MSSQQAQSPTGSAAKPADYVYFERSTAGFSKDALPKATMAKLKLEHFYKVAVESAIERNTRLVRSFTRLLFCYNILGLKLIDVSSSSSDYKATR